MFLEVYLQAYHLKFYPLVNPQNSFLSFLHKFLHRNHCFIVAEVKLWIPLLLQSKLWRNFIMFIQITYIYNIVSYMHSWEKNVASILFPWHINNVYKSYVWLFDRVLLNQNCVWTSTSILYLATFLINEQKILAQMEDPERLRESFVVSSSVQVGIK